MSNEGNEEQQDEYVPEKDAQKRIIARKKRRKEYTGWENMSKEEEDEDEYEPDRDAEKRIIEKREKKGKKDANGKQ